MPERRNWYRSLKNYYYMMFAGKLGSIFSKYRMINFSIGIAALLIYEFLARPFYRPYIYSQGIFDFHIADTLGNTLGTIATIFILIAIFSNERIKGLSLVIIITFSLVLYEIAHPLLGKPIDAWDILATGITGMLSYGLFLLIFGPPNRNVVHTNLILPAGNASDENV